MVIAACAVQRSPYAGNVINVLVLRPVDTASILHNRGEVAPLTLQNAFKPQELRLGITEDVDVVNEEVIKCTREVAVQSRTKTPPVKRSPMMILFCALKVGCVRFQVVRRKGHNVTLFCVVEVESGVICTPEVKRAGAQHGIGRGAQVSFDFGVS